MPETMDEKLVQQQPPPGDAARKAENFRLLARAWVVLIGLSWGGTAVQLLSLVTWLGSSTLTVGRIFLSPGAIAAGVLVAAGIIVGVFKILGRQLVYIRPGLGRIVRLSAFGGVASLTLFGAYALYMSPPISSPWWTDVFGPLMIFGKALTLKPILFPAAGSFLTAMGAVFLVLNQEKWADFLIETEGEIKKVSWPTRKEYLGSAAIVVVVVAVTSLFLHFADSLLSQLMQKLGVGF